MTYHLRRHHRDFEPVHPLIEATGETVEPESVELAPSPMTAPGAQDLDYTVAAIDYRWQPADNTLLFIVSLTNGYRVQVAFPVRVVSDFFHTLLNRSGYYRQPALLGNIESLDGFFSSIEHAVGSVGSVAESAFNHTIGMLAKHAGAEAGKGLAGLARSKTFGAVIGGVAVCFPALGAPALAAWTAAHAAVVIHDEAKQGQNRRAAAQLQVRVGALAQDPSPAAQLTIAGLQSVRADPQQPEVAPPVPGTDMTPQVSIPDVAITAGVQPPAGAPDDSGAMVMPEMTISAQPSVGAPMMPPPPPPPQQNYIMPPAPPPPQGGSNWGPMQPGTIGFHPHEAVIGAPYYQPGTVGFHPNEAVWDHRQRRWRPRMQHEPYGQAYGMAPPAPPPPQGWVPPPPPPQGVTAPPAPPPPPPQQAYDFGAYPQAALPPAPPAPQNFAPYWHPQFGWVHPRAYNQLPPGPVIRPLAPAARVNVLPPHMTVLAPPAAPHLAIAAPAAPRAAIAAPAAPHVAIAAPAAPHAVAAPAPPARSATPVIGAPMPIYRRAQEYRDRRYPDRWQGYQQQGQWLWDQYQGRWVWQSPYAA